MRITFYADTPELTARLRTRVPRVLRAVIVRLTKLMIQLQQRIQRDELQGQILQHHSGVLSGSVVAHPAEDVGKVIQARVTAAAGPAWYGRVQEEGGKRTYDIYPVNKKALAFWGSGTLGAGGGFVPMNKALINKIRRGVSRGSQKAFGQFAGFGGVVVHHVVHPPLPARPFMSTGLLSMRDQIFAELQEAVGEGLS